MIILAVKKAVYYEKVNSHVKCTLCPWNCVIPKGKRGYCGTRMNYEGVLYSLVYGGPTGFGIDPVEKKPLFHYYPGAKVLSFGTQGCNFKCEYCCNYYYSQTAPDSTTVIHTKPEDIVNMALREKCQGIAYTYNEPSIFLEYAIDTMKIAHQKGLFNIFVTNGCINKEPLMDVNPYLDAVTIDFKGFNEAFYKKYVHAKLEWVKNSVSYYKELRAHKEITNLVVPGLNNDEEEVRAFSRFIIDTLGPDTPVHFLGFNPTYKMIDVPKTPASMLNTCHKIAKDEGLNYVYLGNIKTDLENTYCPYCGELLIRRSQMIVKSNLIKDGLCPNCNETIPVNGATRVNNY